MSAAVANPMGATNRTSLRCVCSGAVQMARWSFNMLVKKRRSSEGLALGVGDGLGAGAGATGERDVCAEATVAAKIKITTSVTSGKSLHRPPKFLDIIFFLSLMVVSGRRRAHWFNFVSDSTGSQSIELVGGDSGDWIVTLSSLFAQLSHRRIASEFAHQQLHRSTSVTSQVRKGTTTQAQLSTSQVRKGTLSLLNLEKHSTDS